MSADIMLICEENDEHYKGKKANKCFMIGDTVSMSDIAVLIRYKLGKVDKEMIKEFISLYEKLPTDDFSIHSLVAWLGERKDKYVSYEAW